jgi:hypothetical protein
MQKVTCNGREVAGSHQIWWRSMARKHSSRISHVVSARESVAATASIRGVFAIGFGARGENAAHQTHTSTGISKHLCSKMPTNYGLPFFD